MAKTQSEQLSILSPSITVCCSGVAGEHVSFQNSPRASSRRGQRTENVSGPVERANSCHSVPHSRC